MSLCDCVYACVLGLVCGLVFASLCWYAGTLLLRMAELIFVSVFLCLYVYVSTCVCAAHAIRIDPSRTGLVRGTGQLSKCSNSFPRQLWDGPGASSANEY